MKPVRISLIPFNLTHSNKSKYDIWLQTESESIAVENGLCKLSERKWPVFFFLCLRGNYDPVLPWSCQWAMASGSFLKKGVFLYKGARKGENVNCEDAHLETMLSLRHLCCWLWGKTIKEERKSERERERERANKDCGKLFVERRFLALQSCSPLYLLHLFSCNFRLVKQKQDCEFSSAEIQT